MSDDGVVQPDDVIAATRSAADCVSAQSGPPNVAPVSLAPAEPVDERATELGVERAVQKEVEREVGQLQRVENHPRQHHRLLVDGRRLAERRQMHDEVEQLARVDEHDEHHDDRHQGRVEAVTGDRGASVLRRLDHQGVRVAARQRRLVGGATQALRATERLDQSDVEEREKYARDDESHRRLDPVENVARPGDVAERAEVDEKVFVALA